MKLVVSARAARELEHQVSYLIEQGAPRAARQLKTRVISFLRDTLVAHPRIGRELHYRDLRESWIPGTRLVVWYRIHDEALEIAQFWHTSQDRQPPP